MAHVMAARSNCQTCACASLGWCPQAAREGATGTAGSPHGETLWDWVAVERGVVSRRLLEYPVAKRVPDGPPTFLANLLVFRRSVE